MYSDIVECPENFTYVSSVNGCYYAVMKQFVQKAAKLYCDTLHPNAHLVAINTAAEHIALTDLLNKFTGEYSLRKAAYYANVSFNGFVIVVFNDIN